MAAQVSKKRKLPEPVCIDLNRDTAMVLNADESKLSTDHLPTPSSTPLSADDVLKADLAAVEKLYLASTLSRRGRFELPTVKHAYFSEVGPFTAANGITTLLNEIAAGTGPDQRTGNAIWLHSVTCRYNIVVRPVTSVATAKIQPTYRNVLYRDKIPAAAAVLYTGGSNPPVNVDSVYSGLAANSVTTAVRNPNTFDRFHVYRDHNQIIFTSQAYTGTAGSTVQIGGVQKEWYEKLGFKSTYYGDNAADLATNTLTSDFVTALPAGQDTMNIDVSYDVVFSDAPQS